MSRIEVAVRAEPLSLDEAARFCADPAHGAFASFVGWVRNRNLGRDVLAVDYDVFEPLASKTLRAICDRIADEHDGAVRLFVAHRTGRVAVGEASVVIGASTPHRAEAFAACRAVIEALKHEAPIWKQEHYVDGKSEWVKGHSLCQHDVTG